MLELSFLNNTTLLILLVAWSLPWKGVALWKAARDKSKWWFFIIFITNTMAVLDIIYIFGVSPNKSNKT